MGVFLRGLGPEKISERTSRAAPPVFDIYRRENRRRGRRGAFWLLRYISRAVVPWAPVSFILSGFFTFQKAIKMLFFDWLALLMQ